MSYDSGGSINTSGGRCGGGDKTGEMSEGARGNQLAGSTGGVASDTNDTFTSPPFRGVGGLRRGDGTDHGAYTFAVHADVVEQQYERGRRPSHAFTTAQHPPTQFMNTRRSSCEGASNGSMDIPKRRVPKRHRPSYTSDDDVQPTRAFGASPGTKRALSEMMANDLLRLNVSPTGSVSPSGGTGAHMAHLSNGNSASSSGMEPGGWHHTQGGGASAVIIGFSTPTSCVNVGEGSGDHGGASDGDGGGGIGSWPFGLVSPRCKSPSHAWASTLTGGDGMTHETTQLQPSTFGFPLSGASRGGYAATNLDGMHESHASMGTHGRDVVAVPMNMPGDDGIGSPGIYHGRIKNEMSPPGREKNHYAFNDQELTTPAKSPVSVEDGDLGSDRFESVFPRGTTAFGGSVQDVFALQPQQYAVPELLLRRRSALFQQPGGGPSTGLPVLCTVNNASSTFQLGSGGTMGENCMVLPSSPSADMSPRSDLRKQAILKRASLMHTTGLSPTPRIGSQGGGFLVYNTSAVLLPSPKLTRTSASAAHDRKIIHSDGENLDLEDDVQEFNMDTPIVG